MAGALRKTMVYLGLAEDDERYDGYDEYEYDESQPQRSETSAAERPAAVTPLPAGRKPAAPAAKLPKKAIGSDFRNTAGAAAMALVGDAGVDEAHFARF